MWVTGEYTLRVTPERCLYNPSPALYSCKDEQPTCFHGGFTKPLWQDASQRREFAGHAINLSDLNLQQACHAVTIFMAYLIPCVQYLPTAIPKSNELWTSKYIILVRVLPAVDRDRYSPQLPLQKFFHLSALKVVGERESIA